MKTQRTAGCRTNRKITFNASGAALAEGARWNDEMHRLPTGGVHCIPRGVYRYPSHAAADDHLAQCLAARMALIATEKRRA
jgi:hypothetical protein